MERKKASTPHIPHPNSNCYEKALYNNNRGNFINKRDTSHDVQRTSKDLGNTLLQFSHKHMNKV